MNEKVALYVITFVLSLLPSVYFRAYANVEQTVYDNRYKLGEAKLQEIRRNAELPAYGLCWTNALSLLDVGCKQLTEDTQHKLAIEFSHCFLLKTGRPVEKCGNDEQVAACSKRMTPDAFQVYLEFFTHTQNICFYLEAKIWQERTQNLIERLKDESEVVINELGSAHELQLKMAKQQNVSLSNQKVLIDSGLELQQTLENSKLDMKVLMTDLQESALKQRALIIEVFDRLSSLRSIVMGEFTGFYSVIFYFLSLMISYLLTATPRTSASRFWLLVIFTMNMAAEWLISKWFINPGQLDPVTGFQVDENTLVYGHIKSCRKLFVILAFFVWSWMAYQYRDFNRINNQLLIDIKEQNAELKSLLQPSVQNGVFFDKSCMDSPDCKENTTGYETLNETNEEDAAKRHQSEKSVGRRLSTAVHQLSNAGFKLSSYVAGLRDKESKDTSITDDESSVTQLVDTPNNTSTAKRRLRRRRNEILKLQAATEGSGHSSISTPTGGHYNLRSRGNTPSLEFLPATSPEAAGDDISRKVEKLVKITARNTIKTLRTLEYAQLHAPSTEYDGI